MLFELLKHDAAISTFLYIGYSNRDPNWKLVLGELSEEFLLSQMPRSYRLAPTTPGLYNRTKHATGRFWNAFRLAVGETPKTLPARLSFSLPRPATMCMVTFL